MQKVALIDASIKSPNGNTAEYLYLHCINLPLQYNICDSVLRFSIILLTLYECFLINNKT